MGTVLEKANKIKETKNKLKEAINIGGGQITDDTIFNDYANEIKDIYIDAISDGVDNLYNNFPKVTGDGSEITLDTEEAPMKITLEGNTSQKASILPEGYTQVDYIQSSGTQYIDTGLILTENNSIELEISMNEKNTKNKMVFGSRSGASSNNISINATETIVVDFNNSAYSTYRVSNSFNIDTKYIIYNSKEKRVIYDENRNILSQETNECVDTITTPNTATLFYINPKPSNTWYNASAKIYYCKIWDNDTLVRNIVPCYRNSDNVVGMYDLITDTFYINQGTGNFTYGNIETLPSPTYPIAINTVTGGNRVKILNKNLFDPSRIAVASKIIPQDDGSILMVNATSSSNGYYEFNKNFSAICPELKPGDEVYLHLESDWTSGRRYIYNSDLGQWKNGQKRVLTEGMLNKHLVIYGGYQTTTTLKIMITKNAYSEDFIKFQSQTYPLSLSSNNLLNLYNHTNTLDNKTTILSPNDYQCNTTGTWQGEIYLTFEDLKPNTDYTFSADGASRFILNYIRGYNGNEYTALVTNIYQGYFPSTFNTGDYEKIIIKMTARGNGGSNGMAVNKNIRLIEGKFTSATMPWYIPYVQYPLEFCGINNYKDLFFKNIQESEYYNSNLIENAWYLIKNIDKIILNGTEEWSFQSSESSPTNRTIVVKDINYCPNIYISNMFVQNSQTSNQLIFSNENNSLKLYLSLEDTLTGIESNDSENTKIEKIKSYLSNNNVIIYCNTSSTYINISQENYPALYSQLENIYNNAKSYSVSTSIQNFKTNENSSSPPYLWESVSPYFSAIALKNIDLIESEWEE